MSNRERGGFESAPVPPQQIDRLCSGVHAWLTTRGATAGGELLGMRDGVAISETGISRSLEIDGDRLWHILPEAADVLQVGSGMSAQFTEPHYTSGASALLGEAADDLYPAVCEFTITRPPSDLETRQEFLTFMHEIPADSWTFQRECNLVIQEAEVGGMVPRVKLSDVPLARREFEALAAIVNRLDVLARPVL